MKRIRMTESACLAMHGIHMMLSDVFGNGTTWFIIQCDLFETSRHEEMILPKRHAGHVVEFHFKGCIGTVDNGKSSGTVRLGNVLPEVLAGVIVVGKKDCWKFLDNSRRNFVSLGAECGEVKYTWSSCRNYFGYCPERVLF